MENLGNQCRVCGGEGKLSAIVNYHNIRLSGTGEFEDKMEHCLKCEKCGHSWIPTNIQRYIAIKWWNELSESARKRHETGFALTRTVYIRGLGLTGGEIEEIYKSERPKKITRFDESLFLAYIDKFSTEDKVKAALVLMNELTDEQRHDIQLTYCHACGSKDKFCQCWNDD